MKCGFCKEDVDYDDISFIDKGIVIVFYCPHCSSILSVTTKSKGWGTI